MIALSSFAPINLLYSIAMLFVVLSIASGFFHWRARANQVELRSQIDAWWIFLPIVSLAVCAYPIGPVILSALIVALGLRELVLQLPGRAFELLGESVCFWLIVQTISTTLSSAPLAFMVLFLCALSFDFIVLQRFRKQSRANTLHAISATLVLGLSCIALFPTLTLNAPQEQSWLFYLLALTAINDICQFVSGKLFGRSKIAPHSSPNKTWEGLLGGVVGSSVFSLVLGLHLQLASAVHLACLGFALAIIGFFGDLVFSNTKRLLGIKDFSQLIPGHGGILDRVDSLVFTAPALYLWLSYWFYSPFRID